MMNCYIPLSTNIETDLLVDFLVNKTQKNHINLKSTNLDPFFILYILLCVNILFGMKQI